MSAEMSALLITLLIAIVPNLFLKWFEKKQPKESLQKTTLEAANISFEVLQDTLGSLKEHCEYLNAKVKQKREELDLCRIRNSELYTEIGHLRAEILLLRKMLEEAQEG